MREEVGSLALCALYDCSIGIVVWVTGVMSMGRVCLVWGGTFEEVLVHTSHEPCRDSERKRRSCGWRKEVGVGERGVLHCV